MKWMSCLAAVLLASLTTLSVHAFPVSSNLGATPEYIASATHPALSAFGAPEISAKAVNRLAIAVNVPKARSRFDSADVGGAALATDALMVSSARDDMAADVSILKFAPEPSVILLLLAGIIGLILSRRRQSRQ